MTKALPKSKSAGKLPIVRVTQNEIARLTGLSRSTVSTILSGKFSKNYNEKTRQEVLDVAHRLNYSPNKQALTLKTGKSGTIGIVHTGSVLPLTHQKISATVRALRVHRLEPLVYHNTWFDDSQAILDALIASRADGAILINNWYENHTAKLQELEKRIPVLQFGGLKEAKVPLIAPDKAKAMRELISHLVQEGHTEIVMMATQMEDQPSLNPINAFRQSCADYPHVKGLVIPVSNEPGDIADVYAPGARFLEHLNGVVRGPCAVVAHNDNYGIGLYLACLRKGIRVPEDVAITGWDNVELGRHLPCPLTTTEQPILEMAQRAVEHLLTPTLPLDLEEYFPCRLIVRSSSLKASSASR